MSDIPDWFWAAVETEKLSGFTTVAGCDVHHFSYGSDVGDAIENTQAGLLFVHGHHAHAHWWDFIAPYYLDNFKVGAVDLTGMGDSDHREEYSNDIYADEIVATADALRMPTSSTLVAHSFGGLMAIRAMAKYPDRFSHLVLLDTGVRHPDDVKERDPQIERLQRRKVYPSQEIGQSRFRLQPPQQCKNQYLVDYIARNSLEFDDDGWIWKFDEELDSRLVMHGDLEVDLVSCLKPVTLIYGELSESYSAKSAAYMQSLLPSMQIQVLPKAQHHLFLDEPLAFRDMLMDVVTR